jgi:N-acetylglutamate synthase-like GNAT family acetyltransferase
VHPDWTGHGVGRALYGQCEQVARAAGIQHFECNASLNAEGFYGALGFELVRQIDAPMGPGLTFPSLLMTRAL